MVLTMKNSGYTHGFSMVLTMDPPWSSMDTETWIFYGNPMEYFCKGLIKHAHPLCMHPSTEHACPSSMHSSKKPYTFPLNMHSSIKLAAIYIFIKDMLPRISTHAPSLSMHTSTKCAHGHQAYTHPPSTHPSTKCAHGHLAYIHLPSMHLSTKCAHGHQAYTHPPSMHPSTKSAHGHQAYTHPPSTHPSTKCAHGHIKHTFI